MGTKYIVSIGISNYADKKNNLNSAAKDARTISSLFKYLGFTNPYEHEPICNEKATKYAIEKMVMTDLRSQLKFEDTLVFFFAGHGRNRVDEAFRPEERLPFLTLRPEERMPFLIPYDAIGDEWHTYIDLDSLLRWISKLPAKHILVILNACKSGLALNLLMKKPGVIGISKNLNDLVSRKIITSATHLQTAPDGKKGELTPFALSLIEGINYGHADCDNDGDISWDELGLFLKQSMKKKANNMQDLDYSIPDFGTFHNDDNGNLIISRNREDMQGKINIIYPGSPEELYLNYLLLLKSRGNISDALENVNKLIYMKLKEGIIPLSHHELIKLFEQLESWQMLLSIPENDFPTVKLFEQVGDNRHEEFFYETHWRFNENAIICLKIANTTSEPIYTYMILIDGIGRLSQVTLWDDENIILRGLGPGKEEFSLPIRHFGMSKWGRGCQMRIFSSPRKINEFTYPTLSDFCHVEQSKINTDGVRMKVILYTITEEDEEVLTQTIP